MSDKLAVAEKEKIKLQHNSKQSPNSLCDTYIPYSLYVVLSVIRQIDADRKSAWTSLAESMRIQYCNSFIIARHDNI